MPDGQVPDGHDEGPGPRLSLWQRLLLALPSAKRSGNRPSFGERVSGAVLKPANPDSPTATPDKAQTVEELEHAVRYADDTERLIGLIAAPLAAAIGLVVVANQISNDPRHKSTYHALELMFLAMAALLVGAAWYRKRTFMGVVLALYGLAVFNLHYWEFGVPFVLAGSWYLVRSYRLQRDLKEATAGASPGRAPGSKGSRSKGSRSKGSGPSANKRYTPPPPKRQKPQDKREAG